MFNAGYSHLQNITLRVITFSAVLNTVRNEPLNVLSKCDVQNIATVERKCPFPFLLSENSDENNIAIDQTVSSNHQAVLTIFPDEKSNTPGRDTFFKLRSSDFSHFLGGIVQGTYATEYSLK